MFTEEAKANAALRKALRLLREAKLAIDRELAAAGPDEVKEHPVLRANDKLSDKIEEFLGTVSL